MIEVVVAMTIVGLGVVTLLQIFSQGLRLEARSTARTEAAARGARVMDELLARKRISEGTDTGKDGDNGRWRVDFRTQRDDRTTLSLSSGWELQEVTLEFSAGEHERPIELKTLRLTRKTQR